MKEVAKLKVLDLLFSRIEKGWWFKLSGPDFENEYTCVLMERWGKFNAKEITKHGPTPQAALVAAITAAERGE